MQIKAVLWLYKSATVVVDVVMVGGPVGPVASGRGNREFAVWVALIPWSLFVLLAWAGLKDCPYVASPEEVAGDSEPSLEVPTPHGAVRASAKAFAPTLLLSSGVCCDRRSRAALPLLSTDATTS